MLDIHTVAAGGGSVLHFDGSRYRAGPTRRAPTPAPPATGWRPARRHRRQRHARPHPARPLPGGLRPERRPAPRHRTRPGPLHHPRA
ncbi:hypothetical protein ACR6C2_08970 [Streptomyces sp. INA 01156]